jgi:predicted transcriptional regulator
MADLFTIENKIEIVEVKTLDILKRNDTYKAASSLIQKHQEKYPGIEKWFKNKVLPDIKEQERALYVGINNDIPIATAVVKKGEDSKFCHLHIEEKLRHNNLGDMFFILMSIFIKRYAKKVHFSLPEGLWEEKKNFFNSFGFQNINKNKTQYRSGEEELSTSVNFDILWGNILQKLPNLINQFIPHPDSPLNGIVMSISPNYSKQIFNGKKIIEIRRRFNLKWKNHVVTIYSSSPIKEIVGYATIKNVVEEKPEIIWFQHSDKLGCSKSEFDGYTKGAEKVFAIFLSDIHKFHNNLSLNYLSNFLERKIVPPQSYSSVNNTEWKNVISMAEILHGRYSIFSQIDHGL